MTEPFPWPLLSAIASTGLCNQLCAHSWGSQQVFLVPLGRAPTKAERARARRLSLANLGLVLGALALGLLARSPQLSLVASGLPVLGTLWLVAEMVRVRRTLPETAGQRFAVPLSAPPGVLQFLSPPLQLVGAGLVLASAGVFANLVDQLPAQVPLHYNARGQVDRVGDPRELWLLWGVMVFDWLLGLFVAFGLSRERWALPPDESTHARYRALQMARRRGIVRLVEAIMLSVNLAIAILWLGGAASLRAGGGWSGTVIASGVIAATLGPLLCVAVFMGRLVRVQSALRALAGTDTLGTHGDGWRLSGMIYYAPDDPAVFVPKRVGIGQTVNFARPAAWLLLLALVAGPLLLMAGIRVFATP